MCEGEGRLGHSVDQWPECLLRGASCGFCSCWGHLLLWVFCSHLLAEEAGHHAGSHLQQWADQQRWGACGSTCSHSLLCAMVSGIHICQSWIKSCKRQFLVIHSHIHQMSLYGKRTVLLIHFLKHVVFCPFKLSFARHVHEPSAGFPKHFPNWTFFVLFRIDSITCFCYTGLILGDFQSSTKLSLQ